MSKSNETIYETDFEAGKVKEIYANYHGNPYSFSTEYSLEEKLSKVHKISKVQIRNVQDVYNALTDRDTFDKLLQQGLKEEYQTHRDEIVNLFMGLKEKDKIKIEDLTLYEPIFTLNMQKSKCSICQEFANIHCIIVILIPGYALIIGNNIRGINIIQKSKKACCYQNFSTYNCILLIPRISPIRNMIPRRGLCDISVVRQD